MMFLGVGPLPEFGHDVRMGRTGLNQLTEDAVLHQLKVSSGVSKYARDGVAHAVRVLDLHDRDERDPRLLVRKHKLGRGKRAGRGRGGGRHVRGRGRRRRAWGRMYSVCWPEEDKAERGRVRKSARPWPKEAIGRSPCAAERPARTDFARAARSTRGSDLRGAAALPQSPRTTPL